MLRLSPVVCLLALLLAASAVGATPVLRYTWGDPDSAIVNQDWTGPHTYTQTLSVTGLSGQVSSFNVVVWNSHMTPPAWEMIFIPIPPALQAVDCTGHPAFSVSPDVAGAQTLPGAEVTFAANYSGVPPVTNGRMYLVVTASTPFEADPAVQYAIATLTFDHLNSLPGWDEYDTTHCWGADIRYCFLVYRAVVWRPSGSSEAMALEHDALTWQDMTRTFDCRTALPAQPTTWGRLKAIYR